MKKKVYNRRLLQVMTNTTLKQHRNVACQKGTRYLENYKKHLIIIASVDYI